MILNKILKNLLQKNYSISVNTVDKYVKKFDIPYNKHRNNIKIPRDNLGRFTFINNDKINQNEEDINK